MDYNYGQDPSAEQYQGEEQDDYDEFDEQGMDSHDQDHDQMGHDTGHDIGQHQMGHDMGNMDGHDPSGNMDEHDPNGHMNAHDPSGSMDDDHPIGEANKPLIELIVKLFVGDLGQRTPHRPKPKHAHSRFAQDPHHSKVMNVLSKIATEDIHESHIESFIHIGILLMARAAKEIGMTAGHHDDEDEQHQDQGDGDQHADPHANAFGEAPGLD
ncbi:hypothetical protein LTR67_008932 [Exophiala xenobiotica]